MPTKQITLTGLALILTVLLFHWFSIDLWLQDYFYNTDLKHWALDRDQKIARLVFYDGIKRVYVFFIVLLAAALFIFRKKHIIQTYRQGLMIVLLSCIAVPVVVGGLKDMTNTPCPKAITHYGGHQPYVGFLDTYPEDFIHTESQRCFPAAHASGGFALLSLFFLFKNKKNRGIALTSAMAIGWATGLYKMLIGDHFLSHTIVTMLLAWLIILIISGTIYSKKLFSANHPGEMPPLAAALVISDAKSGTAH